MDIKKILCAIDDSPLAEEVFSVGIDLSQKLGTDFALVSIINTGPTTADGVDINTLRNSMRDDIAALFQKLLQKKSRPYVFKFIENGDPKKKIVEIAKEWKADFIIIGSHGRTGMNRILMGSVAENVLRHSSCPVIVVPAPK
ncbi:MAG: universal stress protein [Bdellovibrio sp.]